VIKEIRTTTPAVFRKLDTPARYKGAYGGRGSGKSHYFAERALLRCLQAPTRVVCIREYQNSLKESSKRLLEDKIGSLSLGEFFQVKNDRIDCLNGSVVIFMGMQDANAESIKSLEGYDIAWVEEAQTLSEHSLRLLRPTIRKENSEIWMSWNPRRKTDPVDKMFRESPPTNTLLVSANWRDNPFFPAVLEQERLDCLRQTPDEYPHIWEGEYAQILKGAYYASLLHQARFQGRITDIPEDPLMDYKLFFDIGGTGAKADAACIVVAQFSGLKIKVIDYYEAKGQPLATHVDWLRNNGYTTNRSTIYLPHDGVSHDKVYSVSYESALKDAGYSVVVIKNQGAGAAKKRIEATRRLFPSIYFNSSKEIVLRGCIESRGWYHERWDDTRQIGLGPEHDFSSHCADAIGLMSIVAEEQLKDHSWTTDTFTSSQQRNRDIYGYKRPIN